jgi:hypothetical protein
MDTKKFRFRTLSPFLILLFLPAFLIAQPSPGELSEQVSEKNSQRIASVNSLTITIAPEEGDFFPETTTRYRKINRNGRDVLVTENTDMDLGVLSGAFDDQLPGLIFAAHTITPESMNGTDVYKIEVDDPDALFELGTEDTDYAYDDVMVTRAVVWIDRSELYPLKLEMGQISEEGFEITVTLLMEDYRIHSGLPVPHRITMNVDGFEDQITGEDLAAIEQYLEDLQHELAQMSPQERELAKEELRPQIEQFQAILESGGLEMGNMVFLITDVRINE